MKKITAFIATFLAFFISPRADAQKEVTNSLLWRISGKNLAKPSYLFGTIHMICTSDYLWTDKMKESLERSDRVCFEMDLDDQAVMMQVTMGLMDNTGKKLSDYFTADQYVKLKKYFKDTMNLDIAMFERMKPAALQTILAKGSVACANPVSYEENIMKTATTAKKEIIGLEDPEEQIAVLESMPIDSIIKEVMEVVENTGADDGAQEYDKMVQAYKKQDLQGLYSLITSANDLADNMGVFLDDRNKRWIQRMPSKMDKSSVFFAVGAGHLWGTNGVISLLKKEGYTVEAVK